MGEGTSVIPFFLHSDYFFFSDMNVYVLSYNYNVCHGICLYYTMDADFYSH